MGVRARFGRPARSQARIPASVARGRETDLAGGPGRSAGCGWCAERAAGRWVRRAGPGCQAVRGGTAERGGRWRGIGPVARGARGCRPSGGERAVGRGCAGCVMWTGGAGRGGGFWAGFGGREAARGVVGLGRTRERGGLRVGFCLGPVWLWVCFSFSISISFLFLTQAQLFEFKRKFEFKPL